MTSTNSTIWLKHHKNYMKDIHINQVKNLVKPSYGYLIIRVDLTFIDMNINDSLIVDIAQLIVKISFSIEFKRLTTICVVMQMFIWKITDNRDILLKYDI